MNSPAPPLEKNCADDFALEIDTLLRAGPTVFRIAELTAVDATLERVDSLERRPITIAKLLSAIGKGDVRFAELIEKVKAIDGIVEFDGNATQILGLDLASLPPKQKVHVLRFFRYYYGLQQLGYTNFSPKQTVIQLDLDRIHANLKNEKKVKASWLYFWAQKFKQSNNNPRSVIPKYDQRGGVNEARADPAVNSAMEKVFKEIHEDEKRKIRTCDIVQDIQRILEVEQPKRPDLIQIVNWTTTNRWVKQEFGEYEICKRNEGKAVANVKFREWYPRDKAEFPLEVFETDDTDTQTFLIDEESGLPFGRGYLTSTIDQHSDIPAGWELSEKPRSTWSALSAVIHSILPKDQDHPDMLLCKAGCEIYGKPGIIVFDNPQYNHVEEIELAAHDTPFIPAWAKPRTPTEKSKKEGWYRRLKYDFLFTQAGFRGSKKERHGLADGLTSANMGTQEFRQKVIAWTFDVYANKPGIDGLTPRQRWHLGLRYARPRIPCDIFGRKLIPYLRKTLKLRPEGIQFFRLFYSSDILQTIRKKYGHNASVEIRFNPNDLGAIYVLNPIHKGYISIPCTNPEYAVGLTLYQHKLILKLARENRTKNPAYPQMVLYREALRTVTEQKRNSKKLLERKIAARTGEIPASTGTKPSQEPEATRIIVVTDLEAKIREIDEIELDLEEE